MSVGKLDRWQRGAGGLGIGAETSMVLTRLFVLKYM